MDAGARLRGARRPHGAGRRALVRGRLREPRPAQPAQHARPGAAAAGRRRRLRDPPRRRAHRGQRRAPGRGGGAVPEPRGGEHRSRSPVLVRADPDQRPARLQHAPQRVSGARRAVDGRPGAAPLAAARRAARRRRADGRRSRSGAPSRTTTRARSAATTASTTRRASCSPRIGLELVEMPRNRDNSFCCGAGGGRIWMREPQAGRPSEDRIHEAVALGGRVTQFVVACPKDVTMYEDAIKTTGSSDRLELAELSELVLEACAHRGEDRRGGVGMSGSGRFEGRVALVTGGAQRHRARGGPAPRGGGRAGRHRRRRRGGRRARRRGERRDHVRAHRRHAGRRGGAARRLHRRAVRQARRGARERRHRVAVPPAPRDAGRLVRPLPGGQHEGHLPDLQARDPALHGARRGRRDRLHQLHPRRQRRTPRSASTRSPRAPSAPSSAPSPWSTPRTASARTRSCPARR